MPRSSTTTYWEQRCSREQADWILRLGMIESRVSLAMRQAIYWAVRALGEPAWRGEHGGQKQRSATPLPVADIATIPALALWPDFRRQLFEPGVRAVPQTDAPPAYCAAAMAIVVDDR